MKIFLITLIAFISSFIVNAQISAVTEIGDKVVLFPNGTWKYENDSLNNIVEISFNQNKFLKNDKSTFLVKSSKTNFGIWLDTKKWVFEKSEPTAASEYKFESKDDEIYAMLIAEKTQIPIESLMDIVFQNAKSAAPDIQIIKKEYRIVNDHKVVMLQMEGTIQGINFIYFGYYFSSENGSIQFLTYCSKNLFEQYKDEMEKFLNGFVEY